MITSVVIRSTTDASRQHERWLRRPDEWSFWRIPSRALRIPLPSVWGLVPLRRLAASLELTGHVCVPVPPAAFHNYNSGAWYRDWLSVAVEIDNRAAIGSIESFPELLGKLSPAALSQAETVVDDDPQAQVRILPLLVKEVGTLLSALDHEEHWWRFSVEWASCRVLLDLLNEAVLRKMSVVFYPEWPQMHTAPAIDFSTIAIRGLHRIRHLRIVDSGAAVEVALVNGQVYRLSADRAFGDDGAVLIARARIGGRRGIAVLTDNRGRTVQVTPHRLLHLCEPTFTD